MRAKMLTLSTLLCLMSLACSSTGDRLPLETDDAHATLTLKVEGQLIVVQSFRIKRAGCREAQENLPVKIHRHGTGAIPITRSCNEATGVLRVESKQFQPPGNYSLSLARYRRRFSSKPALITVRYRNADFASEDDWLPEGGTPLEPGIKVKGEVHYHSGDQTDWFRVKGSQASVGLTFFAAADAPVAEVFAALPGGSGVRRIGTLAEGRSRHFPMRGEDLLVRVRAKELSGSSSYSLLRRDTELARRVNVQVVDCYAIGGGMGVAVLKAAAGIQAGDGVVISASDASGKRKVLGKCTVTTVSEGDASCELPYSEQAEWVDFRADGVFSGGRA